MPNRSQLAGEPPAVHVVVVHEPRTYRPALAALRALCPHVVALLAPPRSRVVRTVVPIALLLLAMGTVASASAAPGNGTFSEDVTTVDPEISSMCGFEVLRRDVGVFKLTTNDAGELVFTESETFTFTAPETGASLVGRFTGHGTVSEVTTDDNGSVVYTFRYHGLAYRFRTPEGTVVSAGAATLVATVTVDAQGMIVAVQETETGTPKIEHLTTFFEETGCALLA